MERSGVVVTSGSNCERELFWRREFIEKVEDGVEDGGFGLI
jgi:hypothetical protein